MTISGTSATDSLSTLAGSSSSGVAGTKELDKNAFLTLLVNQLKHQDPLAPTDNQAFIAQLAQFSSLEGIQQLNDNLVGLAVLQQSNALMSQLTQSSALIGKNVRYFDSGTETELTGSVTSVKIEEGLAVLNIDGKDVPLGNVTEVLGSVADDTTPPPGDTNGDDTDPDESAS